MFTRATGSNLLFRRVAGLLCGVAGLVIIVVKLPAYIWWLLLGALLIYLGWKIFK